LVKEGIMELALNLFLHVLLIGSLFLFLTFALKSALAETDPTERVLRLMAMFAGALVALGANVSELSYADFTVGALAGARAPSAAAAAASSLIPALVGAALGFFIVRTFNKSSRRAQRLLGFLAVLSGVAFAAIYAQVAQAKGVLLGAAALPNISFVAGVMLTIVFTWDPDEQGGMRLLDVARALVRRRERVEAASDALAGREPLRDEYTDI
jgi:hypothetical protein